MYPIDVILLTLTAPIRILRHLCRCGCHFPIAIRKTVFKIPLLTTTPPVDHQEIRILGRIRMAVWGWHPPRSVGGAIPFLAFPNSIKDRAKLSRDTEQRRRCILDPWIRTGMGSGLTSHPRYQTLRSSHSLPCSTTPAKNTFTYSYSQQGGSILQQCSRWQGDTGFVRFPYRYTHPQSRRGRSSGESCRRPTTHMDA